MALISCLPCGKKFKINDIHLNKKFKCPQCGEIIISKNTATEKHTNHNANKNQGSPPNEKPILLNESKPALYFQVSLVKFILMCISTFNFYLLFWFYKNWVAIYKHTGIRIHPMMRTIFSPWIAYSLFRKVAIDSRGMGLKIIPAEILAVLYFVSSFAWRFAKTPKTELLFALFIFTPCIPVVVAINKLIKKYYPDEVENDLDKLNFFWLGIGFILWILFFFGLTIETPEPNKYPAFNQNKISLKKENTEVQKTPLIYFEEGLTYKKQNELFKAIQAFSKAINMDSTNGDFYFQRGVCFLEFRDRDNESLSKIIEALEDFTKAIELNPNNFTFYNQRGLAFLILKKDQEALTDFSKSIELNPNETTNYFYKGLAKKNLEDYPAAIAEFTKAIKLKPQAADFYNMRGICFLELRGFLGFPAPDNTKAFSDFSKAIELDSKFAIAYNNRGLCFFRMEKYEEALKDFEMALKLNPILGLAYENRGQVFLKLGKTKEAESDFLKYKEVEKIK